MKKLMTLGMLLVLLTGTALARITLPEAEEIKLDNGLLVEVIERHNLPLFSIQMTFRAGSTHDPVGQEGLASLAADMLMRGTLTRTARQIADEIAFGGGALSNFCGRVSAGFEGEFLTAQGENAFDILADLVVNSTVAEDEFRKTKARVLGRLQSRKEDPGSIAADGIYAAILGDSRYAHHTGGEPTAVEKLDRDNVVRYVRDHYTPDNSILVVCGDISTSTVHAWVERYFGQWQGAARLADIKAGFPPVTGREVILYDKKDATQTQIRMGGNGMPLNHPDFPATEVARTVYGGSFSSRLMDEIRVNRGLSYGAYYVSTEYGPGGLAYVRTSTANETVGEVVDIILAETERMQTELVPDSELVSAINFQNGTYPLDFETNDDLARVFSNLWLNNLDKSFYEDHQERLEAVTPPQAMKIANKYFPKDNYRLVMVGKAEDIRDQAEKYGRVTVIPLAEE